MVVTGIQGSFDGAGCKTVIPRKVIGKFSIRVVPNMDPATVEKLVVDYLTDIHKKRDSPNTLKYVPSNSLHYVCVLQLLSFQLLVFCDTYDSFEECVTFTEKMTKNVKIGTIW